MKKWSPFQLLTVVVLTTFMSIIVFVVSAAFSRRSGSTHVNMSEVQKIRYIAEKSKER